MNIKKIAIVLPYFSIISTIVATPVNVMAASVYYIGNSLTNTIDFYPAAQLMNKQFGKKQPFGFHMIGAANLQNIWNNPDAGVYKLLPYGYYGTALNNYKWDFVSLQPFRDTLNNDVRFGNKFINLAAAKNPNVQILIHGIWAWKQWNDPKDESYSQIWDRAYRDPNSMNNRTRDYVNQLTIALKKTNPLIKAPRLVPTGEVMYQLDQQMVQGKIPGYKSIFDIYSKDLVHLETVEGRYLTTITYLTTMYGINPSWLNTSSMYQLPATTKRIFDATIWNVVNNYSLTTTKVASYSNSAATPEPLTAMGALTALSFGIGFKGKLKR